MFPDIYQSGPHQSGAVTRHVYTVRADIQPGNSGSPLLAPGGAVYGMVFAALRSPERRWVRPRGRRGPPAATAAASRTAAVSTQPWHCPAA